LLGHCHSAALWSAEIFYSGAFTSELKRLIDYELDIATSVDGRATGGGMMVGGTEMGKSTSGGSRRMPFSG